MRGMVRYGEAFFHSLGFAPLPKTFGEITFTKAGRSGRGVATAERLGYRFERRFARQGVHSDTERTFVSSITSSWLS